MKSINDKKKRMIRKFVIVLGMMVVIYIHNVHTITQVYAQSIQYTYDSIGRVILVTYPNGTTIEYQYDADGNIKVIEKGKKNTNKDDSSNLQTGTTTDSSNNNSSVSNELETTVKENISDLTDVVHPTSLHETAEDIKVYNKFKKRKPVIKSLKQIRKRNKLYLTIQIRKIAKLENYAEGYQIKYATNKKFKKSKSIIVNKHIKKSITKKKWKVKKKRTYYVKVRAYITTKTGNKIYTKYSKVKKIKIKK